MSDICSSSQKKQAENRRSLCPPITQISVQTFPIESASLPKLQVQTDTVGTCHTNVPTGNSEKCIAKGLFCCESTGGLAPKFLPVCGFHLWF